MDLDRGPWARMVAHAYDGLPLEACGLLAGRPGRNEVTAFYPCRNAEAIPASASSFQLSTVSGSTQSRFAPCAIVALPLRTSRTACRLVTRSG